MLNHSDATSSLAQSCIEKLSVFLSDKDQNLRYIALKGLSRLLHNAPHTTPLLARHYDDILTCIKEEDLTIRLKALELVERLTDRSNCKGIVVRLLEQIAPSLSAQAGKATPQTGLRSAAGALRAISSAYDTSSPSGLAASDLSPAPANTSSFIIAHYRYRLLLLILRLTSRPSDDGQQLYVNVVDFDWYVDTLFKCAYLSLSILPTLNSSECERLAHKLSDCLLDVTARAAAIRPSAVTRCRRLLADQTFVALDNPVVDSVTSACAFILGEYGSPDSAEESTHILMHSAGISRGNTGLCLGLMQCLARWLASLAEQWEEEYMTIVRQAIASACEALKQFRTQEGDLFLSILNVVLSELAGPREVSRGSKSASIPDANITNDPEELASNPFASFQSSELVAEQSKEVMNAGTGPPKAMVLLQSIFASYELRALAPDAQALVSPPTGLDLEASLNLETVALSSISILPRTEAKLANDSGRDVDEYGRPRVRSYGDPSSSSTPWPAPETSDTIKKSRKGKEGRTPKAKTRKKNTKEAAVSEPDDIDSIPIIKLELDNPDNELGDTNDMLSSRQRTRGTRAQTEFKSTPSPPPIILSAGGEAPALRPADVQSPKSVHEPHAEQSTASQDARGGEEPSATVSDAVAVKVVKKKQRRKKAKEGSAAVDV